MNNPPSWFAALCALEVVCGALLIVIGAWWGWIYAPLGVAGLIWWREAR